MNKKENIALLINEFVTNTLLEKWSEKYGKEFPDVFYIEISLLPKKLVKISDRYETKEQLLIDDHFEKIAGYNDLYVMNLEDK